MNKTKDSVRKTDEKRVLHAVLPKRIWKDFDRWKADMGFPTTIEAVRYLIRISPKVME